MSGPPENFIGFQEVFDHYYDPLEYPVRSYPIEVLRRYIKEHLKLDPDKYELEPVENFYGWRINLRHDLRQERNE